MQNIEQEILAKNYQLSDFAEELLEGYQCLVNADVVIPENVFNPNIELGFFGVYAEFIASGDNELKQTLDYLQPGMSFRHCKLITNALEANDAALLEHYKTIFTNVVLNREQKIWLAELALHGEEYEHLLHLSGDELREINRKAHIKPLKFTPLVRGE